MVRARRLVYAAPVAFRRNGLALQYRSAEQAPETMVDVERLVAHWQDGAQEDWAVAVDLVERRRVRHGMFFAHLALEKALKARVCRQTQDLAPRLHNLVRLSELAGLQPDESQASTLADLNAFSQSGRYPDAVGPLPTAEEADGYIRRAHEVFQWLMKAS